jgi:hypothetical protein
MPFLIIGILFSIYITIKSGKKWFEYSKLSILFAIMSIIILLDYIKIPLKDIRYLFNLSLPIAFFSSLSLLPLFKSKINQNLFKRIIISIFIILFVFSFFFIYDSIKKSRENDNKFFNAAKDIKELGIDECEILSPEWIPLDYFSENVYPLGRNPVNESLQKGKIILIFKGDESIDDIFNKNDLEASFKLKETDEYTFYIKNGFSIKNCAKKYVFDSPYVENHCIIISKKIKPVYFQNLIYSICEKINQKP